MKIKTVIGIIVSLVWLVFVAYIVEWSALKGLEPNALGDFLAGTFAPLAFFWLILGYLQQGEELQQNTRALQLQADELKNSVEQQKKQVTILTEQLQIFRNKETLEVARIKKSLKPVFLFAIPSSKGHNNFTVRISNAGHAVSNLSVDVSENIKLINKIQSHIFLDRNNPLNLSIEVKDTDDISENYSEHFMCLMYYDGLQELCTEKFGIYKDKKASSIDDLVFRLEGDD